MWPAEILLANMKRDTSFVRYRSGMPPGGGSMSPPNSAAYNTAVERDSSSPIPLRLEQMMQGITQEQNVVWIRKYHKTRTITWQRGQSIHGRPSVEVTDTDKTFHRHWQLMSFRNAMRKMGAIAIADVGRRDFDMGMWGEVLRTPLADTHHLTGLVKPLAEFAAVWQVSNVLHLALVSDSAHLMKYEEQAPASTSADTGAPMPGNIDN